MIGVRIFPNSKKKEFTTADELRDYLVEDLRKGRGGRYNYRSHRVVKKIEPGTMALFRFADRIIGWGEVAQRANNSPFIDSYGRKYEGYLVFKSSTVQVFDPPLSIKKLEAITRMKFHYKGNYNTGQPYYKIPIKFRDAIRNEVKMEQDGR